MLLPQANPPHGFPSVTSYILGSLNHDGQTIWDKNEVLLGTYLGTHWEQTKNQQIPPPPPPPPKTK